MDDGMTMRASSHVHSLCEQHMPRTNYRLNQCAFPWPHQKFIKC